MGSVGAVGCSTFTNELRSERSSSPPIYMTQALFRTYITAFITGANFHAMKTGQGSAFVGKDTTTDAVFAALEQYCGNHPLDRVVDAVQDVYGLLLLK
jgi:hypothetical protein